MLTNGLFSAVKSAMSMRTGMLLRGVIARPLVTNSTTTISTHLINTPAPVSWWRRFSATAQAIEETYPRSMQVLHWGIAAGVITCIGALKMAQATKDEKKVSFNLIVVINNPAHMT